MAEIAVASANETKRGREISMADLFLCKPMVARTFAGLAAEIISAPSEERSNDRQTHRLVAASRLDEFAQKRKTSSHAETREDVRGAVRGEIESTNRVQKTERKLVVTWSRNGRRRSRGCLLINIE